jgi:hypothetical protein
MISLDIRARHDDLGNCPELLDPVDAQRIKDGDVARVSGECVCSFCGKKYYDHPPVIGALWLTKLCDGLLVKW